MVYKYASTRVNGGATSTVVASSTKESNDTVAAKCRCSICGFRNVLWFCVVGCDMVPAKGVWCLCASIGNMYARVCGDYTQTLVRIDVGCMEILGMT